MNSNELMAIGDEHLGLLPKTAAGGFQQNTQMQALNGIPMLDLGNAPILPMPSISVLVEAAKLSIDISQSGKLPAMIKRNKFSDELRLTSLGNRIRDAIDQLFRFSMLPMAVEYQPDTAVLVSAVRRHWHQPMMAFNSPSAAFYSNAQPVITANAINAIACEVKSFEGRSGATKARLLHKQARSTNFRKLKSTMVASARGRVDAMLLLQFDAGLDSNFGEASLSDEMSLHLNRASKLTLEKIVKSAGNAVVCACVDHFRIPYTEAAHVAVLLCGPSESEVDALHEFYRDTWSSCVGPGAFVQRCDISKSPFYYRGLAPEEAAVMNTNEKITRLCSYLAWREYFFSASVGPIFKQRTKLYLGQ